MSDFPLVGYILLFVAVGAGFIVVNLLVGKLLRPTRPHEEKETIYECGEPTIGSAWVQFDLRFYVVALLFVIFDVEVAFFFPWAVVFGKANAVAQQEEAPKAEADKELYEQRARAIGVNPETPKESAGVARGLAWFALADILVFFGVLLVGFAYLWKRGDLQWVRHVASESVAPVPQVQQVASEVFVPGATLASSR